MAGVSQFDKEEIQQMSNNQSVTNRAKMYQLALFPMNNGATNVYFVLILQYIANFGSNVLGINAVFAALMVTGMRVFDAITDPPIGALMDKTNTKIGKFRPFMIVGNVTMAISVALLYCVTPMIPADMAWARIAAYVVLYAIWVLGYTCQTSVTRAAQPILTDDPKQRPLFTIFNTIGSLAGMGIMQAIGPIMAGDNFCGDYNASWYMIMCPIGIAVSVLLTILSIIGIAEKDNEKYFGLGAAEAEAPKISEYIDIIKANKPLQRLMIAGGGTKLAMGIGTNMTVLIMLYQLMMGNYDGLYLPMMVLGYVFAVPFFVLTVQTAQKKGQKASLMTYVGVALACYVGVLVLLLLWNPNDPNFMLSILGENGLQLNLYTIAFILFFGVGYGAYYATADMPIPMVGDCADYETYRSGKFIPGIIGTLFSLVDKLVSSLSATVVTVVLLIFCGIDYLPVKESPYLPGMNWAVIVLFCIIPMVSWALALWAMKGYELDGKRVKTIAAVNAARKQAIADGMSLDEAMKTINDDTINV